MFMNKHRIIWLALSLVFFIEWCEYILFIYLSLEISHCFFADDYIDKSFILTYDVFAIAYISRPLGGLFFFGLLADRRGGEALSFLAPSCWELQQPS